MTRRGAYVGVQGSQVYGFVANPHSRAGVRLVAGRIAISTSSPLGHAIGGIHDIAAAANAAVANHISDDSDVGSASILSTCLSILALSSRPGAGQVVTVSYSTGSAAGDQTASSSGRQTEGLLTCR